LKQWPKQQKRQKSTAGLVIYTRRAITGVLFNTGTTGCSGHRLFRAYPGGRKVLSVTGKAMADKTHAGEIAEAAGAE
jgi:hypothetical protein